MAATDLNYLDPAIWPDSARRSDFGELTIGGVGVSSLVAEFGSPLFIFDEEHVRTRARNYVKAFNTTEIPTDVYYASKAFLSTKVAKWLTEEGLKNSGAVILPPGSLLLCTRATIGDSKINTIPMATNQGFKNVIPFKDTCINYLYYLLQTKKRQY